FGDGKPQPRTDAASGEKRQRRLFGVFRLKTYPLILKINDDFRQRTVRSLNRVMDGNLRFGGIGLEGIENHLGKGQRESRGIAADMDVADRIVEMQCRRMAPVVLDG